MGPPIEKLVSQFRMILVGLGMPNDRSWSSTLLLCAQDPARLEKKVPEKALPPLLGTMLNCGPPRSASPSPPATVSCTSCALTVS
jgi:hypothetical protein